MSDVPPDEWRRHGVKYRLAWVENGHSRVLFDNHHGKADHFHKDGVEMGYNFISFEVLRSDFEFAIRSLGGDI